MICTFLNTGHLPLRGSEMIDEIIYQMWRGSLLWCL